MQLGCLVDHIVHGREGKVDGHQFRDRALADQRRADSRADDSVLSNRRILDPLGTIFVIKPFGDGVRAAPYPHLFTQDEDSRISVQFFHQSLGNRFTHSYSRHNNSSDL